MGKFGEYYYLADEPFERNWRILIWRLRRGYYSTDVASRKTWSKFAKSPLLYLVLLQH